MPNSQVDSEFKFYTVLVIGIVTGLFALVSLWAYGIKENNRTKREIIKACTTMIDDSDKARCISEA